VAQSEPAEDDLGSIFDEPSAEPASTGTPDTRLGALVAEFLDLDRRRVHGDPELDPAEDQRLAEVRELLEYEFGSTAPPLVGTRRSSLRVPAQLKVHTDAAAGSLANLCSLSRGGAFIEVDDPPAPGTRMELAIERGEAAPPLRLAATVRWAREIANMDGPAGVGVEFVEVEDDDFIALEKLVSRELHALARRGA